MASIPFLGANDMDVLDGFFNRLKAGDIFNYASGFLYQEVEKMAERRGMEVQYCPPSTAEYINHGDMTVKVVRNKLTQEQIFHFDLEMLDIND